MIRRPKTAGERQQFLHALDWNLTAVRGSAEKKVPLQALLEAFPRNTSRTRRMNIRRVISSMAWIEDRGLICQGSFAEVCTVEPPLA